MNRTAVSASLTVLTGIAIFLLFDVLRSETRVLSFDAQPTDSGPLEAVNGTAFPRAKGVATITESLAHVRLPFRRTLLGKHLVIRPRFHLDEGDVLEVGVKKTAFWLDYDRRPLAHRILDELPAREAAAWDVLRSGTRTVFLNPKAESPWKTVEEFERTPPTDGPIGLYGNATLPTPSTIHPTPRTRPFRVTDAPESLRAIYAFYQGPDRSNPGWTENEQRFDLTRAFQNEDGSIDIMFFIQRRNEGPIRVLVDEIRFRVEPGWPGARDLLAIVRRNVAQLVRRPPSELMGNAR